MPHSPSDGPISLGEAVLRGTATLQQDRLLFFVVLSLQSFGGLGEKALIAAVEVPPFVPSDRNPSAAKAFLIFVYQTALALTLPQGRGNSDVR